MFIENIVKIFQVISVENWEVVQSFKDHTGTVVSLALASNDEFLVTGMP